MPEHFIYLLRHPYIQKAEVINVSYGRRPKNLSSLSMQKTMGSLSLVNVKRATVESVSKKNIYPGKLLRGHAQTT